MYHYESKNDSVDIKINLLQKAFPTYAHHQLLYKMYQCFKQDVDKGGIHHVGDVICYEYEAYYIAIG